MFAGGTYLPTFAVDYVYRIHNVAHDASPFLFSLSFLSFAFSANDFVISVLRVLVTRVECVPGVTLSRRVKPIRLNRRTEVVA